MDSRAASGLQRAAPVLGSTGKRAADAVSQVRFAFDHIRSLLAGGGASLQEVVHMRVYLKDNAAREHIKAEWLKCFPDPHDCPARHTVSYDLQEGMLLQLEVIAIVNDL